MRVKRNENFGKLQAGYLFPEVSPCQTHILMVSPGDLSECSSPERCSTSTFGRLSEFKYTRMGVSCTVYQQRD